MSLEELANKLINGEITLAQWQMAMRDMIRTISREAAIIAAGGRENMTPAMWGYLGYLVKEQYGFLDDFAAAIAAAPLAWLNGRLLVRMQLYQQAEWATFEQMLRFVKRQEGWTEERRQLGVADHCPGCIEQASLQWKPIGTLEPIGSQQCSTNCHCIFVYRKPDGRGGYIYE